MRDEVIINAFNFVVTTKHSSLPPPTRNIKETTLKLPTFYRRTPGKDYKVKYISFLNLTKRLTCGTELRRKFVVNLLLKNFGHESNRMVYCLSFLASGLSNIRF